MNGREWQIGRVLGIPIRVHVSWVFVFVFVTWSLATGYLPEVFPDQSTARYWAMGGVATLLLFASVLLHELGHSVVALRYRMTITGITLFIFGGVAHIRTEPPRPRAEFLIAIAGPLVSFALGGLLLSASLWVEPVSSLYGLGVLGTLIGSVNIQLGLFNLIPGFPLDGGRVLRAGLWAWSKDFTRATRNAALAGQGFGLILGGLGAVLLLGSISGQLTGGLAASGGWIILIGAFLFGAAGASRRQAEVRGILSGVQVSDLMSGTVVTVGPELTVEEAVTGYFIRYGHGEFPVVEAGRPIGLVTVPLVHQLSHAQWSWRRVGDVMQPWSDALEVTPEMPAIDALEQMARTGQTGLGVVRDGQLIGWVTRSAILRYLQLRGTRGAAGRYQW